MRKINGMELVWGIVFGSLHHTTSTSLHMGSTCPWFLQFEDVLMYFEGDILVIFITQYIWPPHLLLCHGDILVKDVITSYPPPCAILCLLVIFMCCTSSLGISSGAPPFCYRVDLCMMYPNNLSHWLDCFYCLIVTLDLLDLGFMYLRDLYIEMLSRL